MAAIWIVPVVKFIRVNKVALTLVDGISLFELVSELATQGHVVA